MDPIGSDRPFQNRRSVRKFSLFFVESLSRPGPKPIDFEVVFFEPIALHTEMCDHAYVLIRVSAECDRAASL